MNELFFFRQNKIFFFPELLQENDDKNKKPNLT